MNIQKTLFLICLLLVLFPTSAAGEEAAQNQNMILEQYEASGLGSVYQVDSEVFPAFDSDTIVKDFSEGKGFRISEIFNQIISFFFGEFRTSVRMCLILLVVGFLVSTLTNTQSAFGGKGVSDTGFVAGYVLFAGILAAAFVQVIGPAKAAIENLGVVIKATIPVLLSMLSMGGAAASSGLLGSGLLTMIEIVAGIIGGFLFPLILSAAALSIANHMSDRVQISATIRTIKQVVKWVLVFTMAIFTGVFGIYGLAGSALDSSIGKAARFAIGSGIPVVGGIVSDSIETIMGTVGAVRNITGVTGMIVIVAMTLAPIIKTAVVMWIFRLCCVVLEPVSDKRLVALTSDMADNICLVFAILVCICLLFIGCIGVILITGNFVLK